MMANTEQQSRFALGSQGENPRPIDIDGRTKQKITPCIATALNITLHRPYFLYTRRKLQSTVSCLKAEGGKSQRKISPPTVSK
ncbi:hypothetical protein V6Z12_A01G206500 [Gossypium hirsutum]